jgi:uncharacterized RDD family membrane protein YckC
MTEPDPVVEPSPDGEGSATPAPTLRSAVPATEQPSAAVPPVYPPPGYTIPPGAGVPPGYPPSGFPPSGFPPPGYAPPGYPPPRFAYPPPPPPVAPGGALLAEAWERLVAYLVDSAILAGLNLIPVAIILVALWTRLRDAINRISVANQEAIDNGTTLHPFAGFRHLFTIELVALAILVPVVLAISYLYLVTFMYRSGQTIGKKIMKITVVRASDGTAITVMMARKRWLVSYGASTFAPYFSYANNLWLLWDKPYRQCLHDKCAETVVVKSNRE